jgi:hypothetical protein
VRTQLEAVRDLVRSARGIVAAILSLSRRKLLIPLLCSVALCVTIYGVLEIAGARRARSCHMSGETDAEHGAAHD